MRLLKRVLTPLTLATSTTFCILTCASTSAFLRRSDSLSFSRHSSRLTSHLKMTSSDVIPGRPTWQQTMLRIRDPSKTLPFYTDLLGFTLIDKFHFPQWGFSLYFLTTLPEGETYDLTPGTKEAHDYLWTMDGVALELTHNHGTESDPNFGGYHPGNKERDGFGHIAVNVDDVYKICDKLEKAGCAFQKKPDEGRMKGLAFVKDPDGYWVELVARGTPGKIVNECNFSQTMLRVKDPQKSLEFYRKMGMKLLVEKHFDDFSLYFLGSSTVSDDANPKEMFQPCLELTHNHGTEDDEEFAHFSGNEDERKGFGHIGFLVDDVYSACEEIGKMGYGFKKEPDGGTMKGLAFAYDPDGYWIEIVPRGGLDFGDVKA